MKHHDTAVIMLPETTAATANNREPHVGPASDLETILSAWHEATERLQRTHEALGSEVRRLTNELEIKNRELAHKTRLADLGQMASHVAHEVRNGLAPATLYLSLLRRRLQNDSQNLPIFDKLDSAFTALETTVTDLLNFTSDREPVCRSFSVLELLNELTDALAPQLSAQSIQVEIDCASDLSAVADREMLRRGLMNLVLNAVDVMPEGGTLTMIACPTTNGIEIEVADSGPGVRDDCKKIFDPFFTTKSEGTGLGLAIVQRIADAHGGHVWAANCPEGGAAFTIHLPQQQLRAAA